MCGIGAILSRSTPISTDILIATQNLLQKRGPDYNQIFFSEDKKILIVNSVLSIKGYASLNNGYNKVTIRQDGDFLAYNGEIYDFRDSKRKKNGETDTDYIRRKIRGGMCVKDVIANHGEGFFSLLYKPNGKNIVQFAVDATGEKRLFLFSSAEHFIFGSDLSIVKGITSLLGYKLILNAKVLLSYMGTRHLISNGETVYEDISELKCGVYGQVGLTHWSITKENLLNSLMKRQFSSLSNANLRDNKVFNEIIEQIVLSSFADARDVPSASIISGGVDSTLVSYFLSVYSKAHNSLLPAYYCLRFPGEKDPSCEKAMRLAGKLDVTLRYIDITIDNYAESLIQSYKDMCMPLPTHSFASYWWLSKHVRENGYRILYGGEGADEIFCGYSLYHDLKEENSVRSLSPYSQFNSDTLKLFCDDKYLLDKSRAYCEKEFSINRSIVYDLADESQNPNILKSLLMDSTIQLSSTGLMCADIIGGRFGIESRSPFVSLKLIAAWIMRRKARQDLHNTLGSKSELARIYYSIFSEQPGKKYGFSGFPNEAAKVIIRNTNILSRVSDLFSKKLTINSNSKHDRSTEWKLLNIELFLASLEC